MGIISNVVEVHPGTGEPSNDQRAEWVRSGLDAFAEEVFGDRSFTDMIEKDGLQGDGPSVIGDFITDALHMAMKIGFSEVEAIDIAEKAVRMFSEEVALEDAANKEIL